MISDLSRMLFDEYGPINRTLIDVDLCLDDLNRRLEEYVNRSDPISLFAPLMLSELADSLLAPLLAIDPNLIRPSSRAELRETIAVDLESFFLTPIFQIEQSRLKKK